MRRISSWNHSSPTLERAKGGAGQPGKHTRKLCRSSHVDSSLAFSSVNRVYQKVTIAAERARADAMVVDFGESGLFKVLSGMQPGGRRVTPGKMARGTQVDM